MKKSYHSSEVPTRLATITRRTDDGCRTPRPTDDADIGTPPSRDQMVEVFPEPGRVSCLTRDVNDDHAASWVDGGRPPRAVWALRCCRRPPTCAWRRAGRAG